MEQFNKYNLKNSKTFRIVACFFAISFFTNNVFAGYTGNDYKNNDFYLGFKGVFNFVNHGFYVTIPSMGVSNEKVSDANVSMAGQPGFELNFGKYFNKNWRGQFDFGLLGRHDEKFISGYGLNFFESAYYATLSGVYNTTQMKWGGFYTGVGAGIAILNTGIEDYLGNSDKNSAVSLTGSLMFGYEKDISQSVTFDIGLKSSIWYAGMQNYKKFAIATGIEKVGQGVVWNNALMAGIRCKF